MGKTGIHGKLVTLKAVTPLFINNAEDMDVKIIWRILCKTISFLSRLKLGSKLISNDTFVIIKTNKIMTILLKYKFELQY